MNESGIARIIKPCTWIVALLLGCVLAASLVPLKAHAEDGGPARGLQISTMAATTSYTYAASPILAPFNGYIYVKTNNPDPYSFRLVDKSSKYFVDGKDPSEGKGVYHLLENNFLDVVYEKASTYRVKGGYLFYNMAWDSDGGQLVVQEATVSNPARVTYGDGWTSYPGDMNYGWRDTSIKVSCSATKSYTDYLIDTYSDASMGFFEKLDAIESGLATLSHYPRYVYDSSKPDPNHPYPFFATSPYVELTLNEHLNVYQSSRDGILLTRVYPFILDSASTPGTMSAIAKKIDPTCTVSSIAGMHWMIDVTKNGETHQYGWSTPYGNEPIYSSRVTKDFKFDGSSSDFGTHGTLKTLADRYVEYGRTASQDAEALEEQLSGPSVAKAVAPGGWARVASEGFFGYGITFTYIALGPDGNSKSVASDAWVDGRYVNDHEMVQLGQTFADHPKADIIVRNQTYTDYYGKQHTSDIVYAYDSATDTWRAPYYYFGGYWGYSNVELPSKFVLTRSQVEGMKVDRNSKHIPANGYVYDGTEPPGTPFTNVLVTGVSLSASKLTVAAGKSATLKATIKPGNTTDQRVYWTSSNEAVATVYGGTVNGIKDGTATITATTSDGGYIATCKVTVLEPISIAKATVTGISDKSFTGKAISQKPVVKVGTTKLEAGKDFSISYLNSSKNAVAASKVKNPGLYYVKMTGKGNYKDSVIKPFKITTAADGTKVTAISTAAVTAIAKIKSGSNAVPQPSSKTMETIAKPRTNQMTVNWAAVKSATNYLVGYKRSTEKTWSYVVSGGKTSYTFGGMKTGGLLEFRVAVYDGKKFARSEWTQINCRFYREMVSLKATAGVGKINLKWGKVSGATGYQALISNKADLSGAEVVTVEGGSAQKCTLKTFKGKPLAKGKTYYVKMRAIKTAQNVNGKQNTYIGIHTLKRTCVIK